ncbi:MAG: hypothetical protein ACXACH_05425 [Candidatus Hermodarchaeia archaeon]
MIAKQRLMAMEAHTVKVTPLCKFVPDTDELEGILASICAVIESSVNQSDPITGHVSCRSLSSMDLWT